MLVNLTCPPIAVTLKGVGLNRFDSPYHPNDTACQAMEQLNRLRGCEMHMTHIPSTGDEKALRMLDVNLTCDPSFATSKLFVR